MPLTVCASRIPINKPLITVPTTRPRSKGAYGHCRPTGAVIITTPGVLINAKSKSEIAAFPSTSDISSLKVEYITSNVSPTCHSAVKEERCEEMNT
jgi:hypothetical protein